MKKGTFLIILAVLCLPLFGQVDTIRTIAKIDTKLSEKANDPFGPKIPIPAGSEVLVIGVDDPYVKAIFDGQTGFIPRFHLEKNEAMQKLLEPPSEPSYQQDITILGVTKIETKLWDDPLLSRGIPIISIPKGETVKIVGVENSKLKAIYKERWGYLSYSSLEKNPEIEKLIANEKPSPPPAYQSTPSQKSGSGCPAVQCSAYTQKGPRCKNRTTNCSGRCHVHN